MKRLTQLWWVGTLACLLAIQVCAFVLYERDQQFLKRLTDQIASPRLPPSEQAKLITGFFRDKPDTDNDEYFFLPVFRFLRPTPRQIAERGGWCSDRSRLMVVLLGLRHIPASKWALYSSGLVPRHAVVEVDTEQGKMVVDPLFGLWFPRPGGGYYGIGDLRRRPEILEERIKDLIARGESPGTEALQQYPLNRYIYGHARTFNWEKNLASKILYRCLHAVMGAKVDDLHRPAWVEQPALLIIYGIFLAELALVAAWILAAKKER